MTLLTAPLGGEMRSRHGPILLATLCLSLALFSAARCYPSGTHVIVFVQGLYTTYDSSGTQETIVEGHRFTTLKDAFVARGYKRTSLLDYSYAGGAVGIDGIWRPATYACELTDRRSDENLVPLEAMLTEYHRAHKNAHITLVGHSLGGYLVFLEGAREAGRPDAAKLGVDVVVTLDAPLKGVSPDKKGLIDLIPCDKTYAAGAEIVAEKLDPGTPALRSQQAAAMAAAGVRLATLGNTWDCLWNTGHCLPDAGWIDDTDTQFLAGQASIATAYEIASPPLLSHDAILGDETAAHDVVSFVGAP